MTGRHPGEARGLLAGLAVAEVLLAAALAALSSAAHGAGPLRGDLAFVEWLQSLPGWLEPVADAIRAVSGTQQVLAAGVVVALWSLWRRGWPVALMVAGLLATLSVVQPLLKDVVDRPRPDAALVDVLGSATSESFPSGHVLSSLVFYCSGAIAFSAGSRQRLRVLPPATGTVVFVAGLFANSYLGVHWPTDGAGGLLLASVMLLPAWAWAYRRAGP